MGGQAEPPLEKKKKARGGPVWWQQHPWWVESLEPDPWVRPLHRQLGGAAGQTGISQCTSIQVR